MRRSDRIRWPLTAAVLASVAALAAGCADSTIHKIADVGDVKTLSLDAKQRLLLVADRAGPHGRRDRVTCTEPMPDALVAKAAVLAASGKFDEPGGGPTASGNLSGGQAETAGSIGYRDHTIQMLRDGYYRLCEAYMNGALERDEYSSMIRNADTFMVAISALQVIGANQTAPAITLMPNALTASTKPDGTTEVKSEAGKAEVHQGPEPKPASEANAKAAVQIMRDYLGYRGLLARFEAGLAARRHQQQQHPREKIPVKPKAPS